VVVLPSQTVWVWGPAVTEDYYIEGGWGTMPLVNGTGQARSPRTSSLSCLRDNMTKRVNELIEGMGALQPDLLTRYGSSCAPCWGPAMGIG